MEAILILNVKEPEQYEYYQYINIQYSRELPVFPEIMNPDAMQGILNRTAPFFFAADEMATMNIGRFGVELPEGRSVYREFLRDLVVIEGFDALMRATRYSMKISLGHCFHRFDVFEKVARCVHQYFYATEPLQLGSKSAQPPLVYSPPENELRPVPLSET